MTQLASSALSRALVRTLNNVVGAHAKGFNTGSFGIAILGDFGRVRQHLLDELGLAEFLHRARHHRGGAPGHPWHMRPTLLQLPDAPPHPAESAVARRLPLLFQIPLGTESQVHAFVEVIAGFAVPALDLFGHLRGQKVSGFVEKGLVLVGELDAGEIHAVLLS